MKTINRLVCYALCDTLVNNRTSYLYQNVSYASTFVVCV